MELPDSLITTLQNADRVLVLSGAGMSAESGVPTFRDAQTGLWERYRPEDLATPEAFNRNPRLVWDWYQDRRRTIQQVKPHEGHLALLKLESCFDQFNIVTQNVDSLHQRAGSKRVIELHGNIMRSICHLTRKAIDNDWLENASGHPPASPHHPQGMARPDVVWFGESLPARAISDAMELAGRCDVCFSIGTSSMVQPAASLPYLALESGAVVIEINPHATPLTPKVEFSLQSTAAKALSAIAAEMIGQA